MARQGKGMDLFHSGVTLVKSTIDGRAALMADNRASMITALVIHDHALRSLLPKYCGYEVFARLPSALSHCPSRPTLIHKPLNPIDIM